MFESSTEQIPASRDMPSHIAIIMDGNGRWAKRRFLPRMAGHKRGVEAVRRMVRACAERGIAYLTLFAFSSENWRRPPEEVSFLMRLFMLSLDQEVGKLHENGIRFRVIGDLSRFEPELVRLIRDAETLTAGNDRLILTVAANYGGRWDIMQAVKRMLAEHPELATSFTESDLRSYFALGHTPEPDLFIRTGGEQR
ncbi:MAG TPA: polyprenyl diphosphate synthase, partial [Burkholderiales bacterium]|nr:polyprenyl diphosphate synthase [Burkholderiales bacterium]